MKVIDVKNLTFQYNDEPILENINLWVDQGDYVILTGENGSGKTTLMRLLLGELPLQQGSIEIFGRDIATGFKGMEIGYVPQNSISKNQNFPATAEEILMTGLYPVKGKKFARKKIVQALEEMHMEDFLREPISNLSGGQQQRVMLARALVSEPKLLILDEPTVGMDTASLEAFSEILNKKNKEEGLTILMVTHGNTKLFSGANRFWEAQERGILQS